MTRLWRYATLYSGAETEFKVLLTVGTPHAKMKTVRITHGVHARTMSFVLTLSGSACIGMVSLSFGSCHIVLGCQNFKRTIIEIIEAIEAKISTNHGPWKFETKN